MIKLAIAAAIAVRLLSPVDEDSASWDCITMGNRTCGPTNSQGVAPGCYNDQAEIVALWPCYVVVNPDGSGEVYAR